MSHGTEKGKIYASDYEFDVSEIWSPFVGVNCPSLIGKPKLFFIQACRGSLADSGVFMTSKIKQKEGPEDLKEKSDSIDAEVEREEVFVIPNLADLLVMYSTSEGHVSFRNPDSGSWFIQSLCEELRENNHEELMLILTGVLRRVAFGYQSNVPSNTDYDAGKQMPVFMSMLTKTFYLRKRN
jgi:caspase 7